MKPIDVSYPLADALEGLKQKILNDQFVGWSDYQPVGQALDDLRAQLAYLTAERDAAFAEGHTLLEERNTAAHLASVLRRERDDLRQAVRDMEAELIALRFDATGATTTVAVEMRRLMTERDALRAQLAAAQEWQPVGTSEYIECSDGSLETSDESTGYYLIVTGPGGDLIHRTVAVKLPDDVRLYRRTPVAAKPQP